MGFFFLYIYKVNKKFPKSEKLKSFKTIETLFLEGKTISKYPIKVFFLPRSQFKSEEQIRQNLAAFAVPKRKFKLAVDRNRIKRQLRECYRLHKHVLEDNPDEKFVMLFLFLGKTKPPYAELENAMIALLNKLPLQT